MHPFGASDLSWGCAQAHLHARSAAARSDRYYMYWPAATVEAQKIP